MCVDPHASHVAQAASPDYCAAAAAAAGNYCDCCRKRANPLPLCVRAGLEACLPLLHVFMRVSVCACAPVVIRGSQ